MLRLAKINSALQVQLVNKIAKLDTQPPWHRSQMRPGADLIMQAPQLQPIVIRGLTAQRPQLPKLRQSNALQDTSGPVYKVPPKMIV